MIWNDEAKEKYKSAAHCHVCKNQLEVIKCEIIVISLENFVELHIANATRNKRLLSRGINYQLYFVIFVGMMLT